MAENSTLDNVMEMAVPVGLGATVIALMSGLKNFQSGDAARSQTMMRARVVAQGFTVCMMMVGLGYGIRKKLEKKRLREEEALMASGGLPPKH